MAQVVQAIIEDKSESKFHFYLIQISHKMCCLSGSSSLFFPSCLQIKIFTVYISFQIDVFVLFICTYPGVKFLNHMYIFIQG